CGAQNFDAIGGTADITGPRPRSPPRLMTLTVQKLRAVSPHLEFWALWSCGEQKNAKICLPLGITTKSDFVFTRPRPSRDMRGSELLLCKIGHRALFRRSHFPAVIGVTASRR